LIRAGRTIREVAAAGEVHLATGDLAARLGEFRLLRGARCTLREAKVGRHHEEADVAVAAVADRLLEPRLVAARDVAHADDERRHLVPCGSAVINAPPTTTGAVRRAGSD
jgi:hypothetical protein